MSKFRLFAFIHLLFAISITSDSLSEVLPSATYPFSAGHISVFEKDENCFLSLDGKIQDNVESTISKGLADMKSRQCRRKIVLLTSKGGNLAIAMRLGNLFRSEALITQVHEECDSACGLVFVGGVERLVDVETDKTLPTKFLVHQPTVPTISGINRCLTDTAIGSARPAKIRKYLLTMLPDLAALHLYRAMMNVSCDSEKNITPTSLLDFKIATGTGYVVTEVDSRQAIDLITKNGCFKCHSIHKDGSGPSFSKVGKFYRGKPGAVNFIVKRLTSGDKARFPDEVEKPHIIVKTTPPDDAIQIENLANWILGQ